MYESGEKGATKNATQPMQMRVETDDGVYEFSTETTMVGDTVEIYDTEAGFWSGVELSNEEKRELRDTLWWSLYHDGETDERPPL